MLKPKTPYPDWAAPYVATWYGDQWIVEFTNRREAHRALLVLQPHTTLRLAAASFPGGGNLWYVGVVD